MSITHSTSPTEAEAVPRAKRRPRRDTTLLVLVVVLATAFTAFMAWPTTRWSVMSDEMQTWKIGLAAGDGHLLPTIHDVRIAVRGVLYPYVLAPIVHLLDPEAAFRTTHVLNALLMSLATVPAFLVTRRVVGSATAGYLVAIATALSPWTVLSATVLSEVVAYPAFALALWLTIRAIDEPRTINDLVALAAIGLAALARTQLVLLALLLPPAVLLTEVLWARRGPDMRSSYRAALRTAMRGHLLLMSISIVGLLALLGAQVTGGVGRLTGTYSVALHGDLIPAGTFRIAGELFDAVASGVAVLPLFLALAFSGRALARPRTRAELALAVICATFVPLLMLQAASFTVRFVAGQYPQDRYVGYAALPILIAGVAYLAGRRPGRELLPAALVAFWLLSQSTFTITPIIWASPAIAGQGGARELVGTLTGWLGLQHVEFGEVLRLGILLAAAAFAFVARGWNPRRMVLAIGAPIVLVIAGQTAYAWIDVQRPFGQRQIHILNAREPQWIDRAAGDERVALVPHASVPPDAWWDGEFFNRRVDQAISVDGGPTYTPFSAAALTVDPATGAIQSSEPVPHELVLRADGEHRLGWRGERVLARSRGTRLVRVDVPYKADWFTTGAASDGSIERQAALRVLARGTSARRPVRVKFALAPEAQRPVRVRFGDRPAMLVGPGDTRALKTEVCVSAGQGARIPVGASGAVPATGLPPLSVKLVGVAVGAAEGGCQADR